MKIRPRTQPFVRRGAPAPGAGSPASDDNLALLAKALGHPVRVAILRHLLHHGGCICGDLVDLVPLAQSTVSQHLKVLREAGLLQGEIDGPRVCYCADRETVRRLRQLISDL